MDEGKNTKFAILDLESKNNKGETLLTWTSPRELSENSKNVPSFKCVYASDETQPAGRVVDSNWHAWIQLSKFFTWAPSAIRPAAICEFDGSAPNTYVRPFMNLHFGNHEHFGFVRGGKSLLANPHGIEKVRFITGQCLFSNRHLRATSNDGSNVDVLIPRKAISKPIERMMVDDGFSFYELESSMRLTRFLVDVAKSLPENMPFEIRLDIPYVQYYFYLVDAFWRNLISRDLLLFWFEVVEKRRQLAIDRMKRQIAYWSANSKMYMPEIIVNDGLQSIKHIVVDQIIGIHSYSPAEMAVHLEKNDPAWRILNKISAPDSYLDIVYTSYRLEQLRANIEKQSGTYNVNMLTVSIDNREESPTYDKAVRQLSKIGLQHQEPVLPIVTMYPLEQFLIINSQKWGLYSDDPGNKFYDATGRSYTIQDLLTYVYGAPLESLMNKINFGMAV